MNFTHNMVSWLSIVYSLGLSLIKLVDSHSWAACSKYSGTINGQDYNDGSCVGYPRDWGNEYAPRSSGFGADVGADYQPGGTSASGTWCDRTLDTSSDYSGSYPASYPMAEYSIGETIRIVWPAKNHANYECFGNIPDAGMKLFVNTNVNPTSDPQTLDDWTLVHDWHTEGTPGTDGVPFQNCPSFCDNTDRAVCFGDVTLDNADLFSEGDGYYTFMWYWAFNNDEDLYTTCWEARVTSTGGGGGTVTDTPIIATEADESSSDDTNSNTADSEDSADSDGSEDSEDSSEALEYLIFVPICVTGATYDETIVLDAASSIISDNEWSISASSLTQNSNAFNVTISTHTGNSDHVKTATTAASNDNHLFCQQISTLYIDTTGEIVVSCNSCSDVLVYREIYEYDDDSDGSESNSNGNGNSDGINTTILIIIIIGCVVLIIIIAAILYYKFYYLKYNRRSNHYGSQDYGHSKKFGSKRNILSTTTTSSQHAISYIDEDKGQKPTLR